MASNEEITYRPKKEQGSRQPPRRLEDREGEEDVNSWWSDYGWIKIEKITNKTSHTLKFTNPYETKEDSIEIGQSESSKCVGYLPYTSSLKKYVIKYYNKAFDEWTELVLNDVERDWLMSSASVRESMIDEDIREVSPNPEAYSDYAKIEFIFNDNGYEIYDETWKAVIARLSWT